jgi:protein required for attachment to host cells
MRCPQNTLVALANGKRFLLMRNTGQAFEPKLEKVQELDLELTNFSAGVRHQDPAGERSSSTDINELAHGAAIAEWLNDRALKGRLSDIVIVADPKTLGQIRQHCHEETEKKILGDIAKDLTNQPMDAIERAIADA